MSKTIELSIPRRMSTPVRMELVAEHLPAPLQESLADLLAKRAELGNAWQALSAASGETRTLASKQATEAEGIAKQALIDFVDLNAASSTAIKDSAAAAFAKAMEDAAGHLRAALDCLADASQACALHHSVRSGKPVLRLDSRQANDSETRYQLSMARGDVQDVLSKLPDAVDE